MYRSLWEQRVTAEVCRAAFCVVLWVIGKQWADALFLRFGDYSSCFSVEMFHWLVWFKGTKSEICGCWGLRGPQHHGAARRSVCGGPTVPEAGPEIVTAGHEARVGGGMDDAADNVVVAQRKQVLPFCSPGVPAAEADGSLIRQQNVVLCVVEHALCAMHLTTAKPRPWNTEHTRSDEGSLIHQHLLFTGTIKHLRRPGPSAGFCHRSCCSPNSSSAEPTPQTAERSMTIPNAVFSFMDQD